MRISTTAKAKVKARRVLPESEYPDGSEILGWVEDGVHFGALVELCTGTLCMMTPTVRFIDQAEAHAHLAQSQRGKRPKVYDEAAKARRREMMAHARKSRHAKTIEEVE